MVYPNRSEEVWHALTDLGSLADWPMENDFKPLPGHKFHFRSKSRFGIERLIPCELLVVDEPRLLSWNWGNEGIVVTFRLEAITGGTRLIWGTWTCTGVGFESLPDFRNGLPPDGDFDRRPFCFQANFEEETCTDAFR